MQFHNLDTVKSYKTLLKRAGDIKVGSFLTAEGIQNSNIDAGGGLSYNYAAKAVDEQLISQLQDLADEQQVIEKYKALLSGTIINTGENRMVLHQLTRGELNGKVVYDGKDQRQFYISQLKRIQSFAHKVQKAEIKGSTGKPFDTVVQIGIGGSDLGPRALYLALENMSTPLLKAHFISNVDPDDANAVLKNLNLETTLFILVSKSGTTQETLANRNFVIEKSRQANISGFNPAAHMIAVTSETSPLAGSSDVLDSFYMDDFIGGRYSSTSAVGGAVLSLAFGYDVFEQILEGASEADALALNSNIKKNASLMDAMLGIFERNVLGYPSTAVLPYSQALSRFPAHLQQMDMESNGKSVSRDNIRLNYSTGPVIFGEPGTNGQHSFYQLLHQGTDIIPLQFIGFKKSQINSDLDYEGSTSQQKLKANLVAQVVAFARGSFSSNTNKNFEGGRPSSLILGEQLTAKSLGALLAHFENKVMFQGFVWNLNSFDQEGVQLGKVLAKQVLSGGDDMDVILKGFADLLEI
ncbi:glucose-6-phosphate isomerase [Oceanispirochaeta crateris]|uniref:glucose-6-phosphate isomerase n=1 Tax=Oceanispirochaeta crateris TaxID=2518645 RepID=UPI003CCC71AD